MRCGTAFVSDQAPARRLLGHRPPACGSLPSCAAGAAWAPEGCRVRNGASSPPPPPPSLTLGRSDQEPPLSPLSHHDPQARPGARHEAEQGPASAAPRASRRARAVPLFVPPRGVPAVLRIFTVVRRTGAIIAAQQLGAAGLSAPSATGAGDEGVHRRHRATTGRRRLCGTLNKPAATGAGGKDGRRRHRTTTGRRRLFGTLNKPVATGAGGKDGRRRRRATIGRHRLIVTQRKPAATEAVDKDESRGRSVTTGRRRLSLTHT